MELLGSNLVLRSGDDYLLGSTEFENIFYAVRFSSAPEMWPEGRPLCI
jgi:hypothetical protein